MFLLSLRTKYCESIFPKPFDTYAFYLALLTFFATFILWGIVAVNRQYKQGTVLAVLLAITFIIFGMGMYSYCPLGPDGECTMQVGMSCKKFSLASENGKLSLTLVNGLQKKIVVTGVSCTRMASQFEKCDIGRCLGYSENSGGVIIQMGESTELSPGCNNENGTPISFRKGDTFEGKLNVQYYFADEGSRSIRNMTGNVNIRAK